MLQVLIVVITCCTSHTSQLSLSKLSVLKTGAYREGKVGVGTLTDWRLAGLNRWRLCKGSFERKLHQDFEIVAVISRWRLCQGGAKSRFDCSSIFLYNEEI